MPYMSSQREIQRTKLMILSLWSLGILVSFLFNVNSIHEQTDTLARREARAYFKKDTAIRYWASRHGGVYVAQNERTPANPRLAHIPHRDLTRPDGTELTLMNPAYIIRQMFEEFSSIESVSGRIFSDKYFYEGNKPDAWELKALQEFREGSPEAFEFTETEQGEELRLAQPLFISEDCLKCHAVQGYRIGELRGAVGVKLNMKELREAEKSSVLRQAGIHALIFLLGFSLIWTLLRSVRVHVLESAELATRNMEIEHRLFQKEKKESLDLVTGSIAHDFNNLLTGVLGAVDLIDVRNQAPDKIQKYLDIIRENCLKGAKLSRQMQIYTGQYLIRPAEVDPKALMQDLAWDFRSTLRENCSLELQLPEGDLSLFCDGEYLRKAVLELLQNAEEATRDRGGTVTLALEGPMSAEDLPASLFSDSSGNASSYLKFRVADDGEGMPASVQDRIFDPFFSTRFTGRGLGLSEFKGILDAHHGFFSVNSTVEAGTEIIFYLPVSVH